MKLVCKSQNVYIKGWSVDTALPEFIKTVGTQHTLEAFLDIEEAFNNGHYIESIVTALLRIGVSRVII